MLKEQIDHPHPRAHKNCEGCCGSGWLVALVDYNEWLKKAGIDKPADFLMRCDECDVYANDDDARIRARKCGMVVEDSGLVHYTDEQKEYLNGVVKDGLYSVNDLWQHGKDRFWDVCNGRGEYLRTISLEGMLRRMKRGSNTLGDGYHEECIFHWVEKLTPFVGREEEIPNSVAMKMEGWDIEDGNHRLVAAVLLGLEKFPVKVVCNS